MTTEQREAIEICKNINPDMIYFANKVTELRLIRIKLFFSYNQPILYLMSQ